ncbi:MULTISPECIES: PQQ-dependent sugar dehydrogenase [unclassified Iodidimonas]|jgi:glucose/arabinose dehydrogenase|uniref:PQQ-dependent sugar dehydrogenase n=1 Tax=unclassified Iodidimonas TaxID=2626145 RepID=UPI00248299AD|nr:MULTISPECIES: PQQ-dependent sugar dehydrogenase [unclassified Iodidimonas]
MKRWPTYSLLILGLMAPAQLSAQIQDPSEQKQDRTQWSAESGTVDSDLSIRLPKGFKATLFADDLGRARHLAVRADGTVYASLYGEKDGGWLWALSDDDGDGKADRQKLFGDYGGTGLAIHDGWLYFSSNTKIGRYKLGDDPVPTSAPEVIVSGFPEQSQHATKPMTFDGKGAMFVTVGAPSNACQERARTPGSMGLKPCPQLELQAGIWHFNANETGQVHGKDGSLYATGIRNGLAMDWNKSADALYFLSHGRDQLSQLFPQYYNDQQNAELPAEEFHKAYEGSDHGWPYSYWDHIRGERMVAPEYGGDGKTPVTDADYAEPLSVFPGHWAPNDLVFYDGSAFPDAFRHGAFIAFHGSWNRAPLPQAGYNVAFIPMDAEGLVTGEPIIFADGFKGTDELASPRAAKHRPTGLAVGPDGALYIADDAAGRIWKVTYEGR